MVKGLCPNSNKIGYTDELDAMLALNDLGNSRDHKEKTERSYYECDGCGLYHLTSWRVNE